MASYLLLVAGVGIVVIVTLDFLLTTIGASGQALISKRLCKIVFGACRAIARRGGGAAVHKGSGPFVMGALAAFWIAALCLGWALIFAAFPDAITTSPGEPPASAARPVRSPRTAPRSAGSVPAVPRRPPGLRRRSRLG